MKNKDEKMIIEKKISQEELENLIKKIEKRVENIKLNEIISVNNEYEMEIIDKKEIIPFNNSTKKVGQYIVLNVKKTVENHYFKKNNDEQISQRCINTSENEVDKWGLYIYYKFLSTICPLY